MAIDIQRSNRTVVIQQVRHPYHTGKGVLAKAIIEDRELKHSYLNGEMIQTAEDLTFLEDWINTVRRHTDTP